MSEGWPETPQREVLAKVFGNDYDLVRRFETIFQQLLTTVPTDVDAEIAAINATLAVYAANFTTAVLIATTSTNTAILTATTSIETPILNVTATAQLLLLAIGLAPAGMTATAVEILDKGTPQGLIEETGDVDVTLRADSNRTATENQLFAREVYWDGTLVGEIAFYSGDDTANKDDGYVEISTGEGGVLTPWLRIEQNGNFLVKGLLAKKQETPNAETTAVTLTAADLLNGINTGTHATGANIDYQLPTGTDLDAGVLFANDDSFDWVLINLSGAALDTITIIVNTDHTVVGNMIVQANNAASGQIWGNTGTFRTRKTAANTFVTYRIA